MTPHQHASPTTKAPPEPPGRGLLHHLTAAASVTPSSSSSMTFNKRLDQGAEPDSSAAVPAIAVVPLAGNEGLVQEALNRLYALFGITRDVLRRHGPQVAIPLRDSDYSLGQIAVAVLNDELRPLLARWHPALEDWEAHRPPDRSRVAHEDAWQHTTNLRAELVRTRRRPVRLPVLQRRVPT